MTDVVKTKARTIVRAGTDVSREVVTLLTGAMGIVAALSWSDAVKGTFEKFNLFRDYPVVGPYLFATFITLATYVATVALSRYAKDKCTKVCKD